MLHTDHFSARALATSAFVLCLAGRASAATYTVDDVASLRAALVAANESEEHDTIELASGEYHFTNAMGYTSGVLGGQYALYVSRSVTLRGSPLAPARLIRGTGLAGDSTPEFGIVGIDGVNGDLAVDFEYLTFENGAHQLVERLPRLIRREVPGQHRLRRGRDLHTWLRRHRPRLGISGEHRHQHRRERLLGGPERHSAHHVP
jgi:hypothetical protein